MATNSVYLPVLCHTEMFGIKDEKGLFLSLDHINDTRSLNFCMKGYMMTLLRWGYWANFWAENTHE